MGIGETGVKINGKIHWFWTWQNEALTFIVQSQSRGYKTIQATFPAGLPDVVFVHDRTFQAYGHQICLAHLFRDLNCIEQVHQSAWAGTLTLTLKQAIALNNDHGYNALMSSPARNKLEQSLADLLQHDLPDKDKLAIKLQKKLRKIGSNVLCFLYHNNAPPDNNGSERAIRNIKVKQKVSGGFRFDSGADGFAILRSVIDTTIKSGMDVFYAPSLTAKIASE